MLVCANWYNTCYYDAYARYNEYLFCWHDLFFIPITIYIFIADLQIILHLCVFIRRIEEVRQPLQVPSVAPLAQIVKTV